MREGGAGDSAQRAARNTEGVGWMLWNSVQLCSHRRRFSSRGRGYARDGSSSLDASRAPKDKARGGKNDLCGFRVLVLGSGDVISIQTRPQFFLMQMLC